MSNASEPAGEAGRFDPRAVIDFWTEAGRKRWFKRDEAFDAEIRRRFLPMVGRASEGAFDAAAETPHGALALVLLLDQFTRNLFRGEARAFAADPRARRIALYAVRKNVQATVAPQLAAFLYLPFEHSETLADQDRSCALFRSTGDAEFIAYADLHRDVIVRFGRFPHRNKALGRATTTEEQAFLDGGGFSA